MRRIRAMAETQINVRRNQSATPARHSETRPAALDPFRAMDRMFDQFLRGFGFPAFRRMTEPEAWSEGAFSAGAPAIDFAEDENAYHLTAELPGLSEKDINLTISDDLLT